MVAVAGGGASAARDTPASPVVPPPFVLPLRAVIVPAGEMAALRRLFEGGVAPAAPAVGEIVIPAIAIAPIIAPDSEGDPK
jgi:hypothetical protein